MQLIPSPLQQGDIIALVAPSRWCTAAQVNEISELILSKGFRVKVPEGLLERDGQLAGSDQHRARILNEALNDETVKAVLCMRGGYGAGRLLPLLEINSSHLPWLCGFSDVTALHCWIQQQGGQSLHSPVATTLLSSPEEVQQSFFDHLEGKVDQLIASAEAERSGEAEGIITGGNLSVLYSLRGTPYFPDLTDKILVLEDLDEMLYHLDRMMNNLWLSGEFKKLKGLVIGQFSDMRDNTEAHGFSTDNPFGYNTHDILKRFTETLEIPVCSGWPLGHEAMNMPLVLGKKAKLTVNELHCQIDYV